MSHLRLSPAKNEAQDKPLKRVPIEELMGAERKIEIIHQGERYLLQRTRQNKLILTK